MPIDPGAVGTELDSSERRWDSKDSLLYALGVGAGVDELAFTTENSVGIEQRALPTMGVVLGSAGGWNERIGSFDWAALVHAEQGLELHEPVPVEGHISTAGRISGIWDKGKGALVAVEGEATDAATGRRLFTTRSSLYIRGEGGWGGDRGPSTRRNTPPERSPDQVVTYQTSPDQALLYRLNGDRNPLHSDPTFAQKAGFDRPILHGLCTYGFTGRALLHALCGGDPDRFREMEGRFSAPVFPGDELTVRIWIEGGEAVFQTLRTDGTIVIDGGRCRFD